MQFNSSEKEVVSLNKTYTGKLIAKVIAINPTLQELKALGINYKEEINYTTETTVEAETERIINKYKATRIDVWIKGDPSDNAVLKEPIITKVSFWLEARPWESKSAKVQWLNKFGQTSWVPKGIDISEFETPSFFKKEGTKIAMRGEENLLNWLRVYGNIDSDAVCSLNDAKLIAEGNVSELHGYHQQLAENKAVYLLGVNTNGYQVVYNQRFGRTYEKNNAGWIKSLEGQYSQFKADYQNDLTLKEYEGSLSSPDSTNNSGGTESTGEKLLF